MLVWCESCLVDATGGYWIVVDHDELMPPGDMDVVWIMGGVWCLGFGQML